MIDHSSYRLGVNAIIFNSEKQILLENLTSFKNNYWSLPGGGIDDDETKEDAIKRELKEELGIDKEHYKIIKMSSHPMIFKFKSGPRLMHGKHYVGQERYVFHVKFTGLDSDICINTKEVRKYQWINVPDLKKYLVFDNQLEQTIAYVNEFI